MSHDVFISYSSIDRSIADAICSILESRGISCWIAPRNIMPGVDWSAAIVDAIQDSKLMILVFSSHANASRQIYREVERAINAGITVLPYRLQDVEPARALEYYIGSLQWLDAYSGPQEDHLEMLADTVSRLLNRESGVRHPRISRKFSRKTIVASSLIAILIALIISFAAIKTIPIIMNRLRASGVVKTPKPSENKYYKDGLRQFEEGKYDEAIKSFDKAIQQDPNMADAYHYRGQAYSNTEKYPDAIVDYNKVLQLEPKNPDAYYHRGQAYNNSGNYDQAIVDFAKAIGLKPDFSAAYKDRAQAYKKKGNEVLAAQDLSEALKYDPNQAEIYYERGLSYQKLDQHSQAIGDFTETLRLDPKHAKAANNRGLSNQAINKIPQAIADFTQAIKIQPNFAEPYCNRGTLYLNEGRLVEAKRDFDRCGKLDPGWKSWTQNKLKQIAEKESKNIFQKLKKKFKKIF